MKNLFVYRKCLYKSFAKINYIILLYFYYQGAMVWQLDTIYRRKGEELKTTTQEQINASEDRFSLGRTQMKGGHTRRSDKKVVTILREDNQTNVSISKRASIK
uniref:Uncharacterized protein n=1 Tax=Strongyloides venezuelensis TaxID=75913 RepID=A0A0K0EYF9_STRVS